MTIRCIDLRCERLVDPLGLDARDPRLSWRLDADAGETDIVQRGYQVEIDGLWDTGRLEGRQQQVRYGGPALASRRPQRWRARAWTSAGDTDWSDWATFEPGLLDPGEWVGTMIKAKADTPVVRFSRVVEVPDDVVSARLRLTAQGIVGASIDGEEVGDEVLAPGWTAYKARLAVRTHDVTPLLRAGRPCEVALTVAPGWFSGRLGFGGGFQVYGNRVAALAQLELLRADGSLEITGTDTTWTATSTPYLLAELYDGETYDARLPAAGAAAAVAIVDSFDPSILCTPAIAPVRRTQRLPIAERNGSILDFGQNLVGWLRITMRGVPAGTEVVLRHAEVLDDHGALFTAPLRTARATDTYIAAGLPEETYEPRFTFHGFRYAEITGVDPADVDIEAVVIHSDLERTGTFTCSDPLLERLHENVVWGLRGNFVSVPTDCPQRDERLGWTGDAQVFAPTASFLYDCEGFWRNWLADLAADQRDDGGVPNVIPDIPTFIEPAAGWGDAATVVPWTTYLATGDDTVLREALPSMQSWLDFVWSRLDDRHRWTQDFQFGDWLDPDAPAEKPWEGKARFDLVASAYAARTAGLVSRAAGILGEVQVAAAAAERAAILRDAWWRNYGSDAASSQTAAAMAICFDLAPAGEVQRLGDALAALVREADDHLATGFLGTPLLLPALTMTGHLDAAYDVLLQRTSPSWLYQVLAGATTIWERWDALRPDGSVVLEALGTDEENPDGSGSMVSFNHYAYGAVAEWLHTTVAGIRPDPDDPGYRHVLIEPRPGGALRSASASVETRYGRASVSWRLAADGRLRASVEVPPNCSATVLLPGHDPVELASGTHELLEPAETGTIRDARRAPRRRP